MYCVQEYEPLPPADGAVVGNASAMGKMPEELKVHSKRSTVFFFLNPPNIWRKKIS